MTTSTTERDIVAAPAGDEPDRAGWEARKGAAQALRVAAMLVPALGSFAAVWFASHAWLRPLGAAQLLWWVSMFVLALASYWLLERLARRALPLATLLRLSLVFPDRTPSRYRVALIAGSTRNLARVMEQSRRGVVGETPAECAERLLVLVAALNTHDRLTRGHSERVRAYAEVIGNEMGLDRRSLERLRWAALLHDVGKVEVPAEILNKKGRLTDEEFEVIKGHPAAGAALVEPLRHWLGDEILAVVQHHERFDGTGYPLGLSGEDISLAGRIVSVADTFDVITSARSYKKPVSPTAARAEIQRCAGTQFDPKVARALLGVSLGRLWLAGGSLAWGASIPGLASVPGVGAAPGFAGTAGAGVAATAVIAGVGAVGLVSAGVASVDVTAAEPTAVVLDERIEPDGDPTAGEVPDSGASGSEVPDRGDGEADPDAGAGAGTGAPDGSTIPEEDLRGRSGAGGASDVPAEDTAPGAARPSGPATTTPPPAPSGNARDGGQPGAGRPLSPVTDPVLGDDGVLGGDGPVLGDDGVLGGDGPVLGDDGLLGGDGPVLGDDGLLGDGGPLGGGGLLGG